MNARTQDMQTHTYGYARVSSADQNLSRQIDALLAFPISHRHIYTDKASGKGLDRPSYRRLLKRLAPGDTLVVKSIDRLGRNYQEILDEWHHITKEKQAMIVVLDMPLLDTRKKIDGLTGTFLADLVLQILSYVAQIERENIRQRQAEGIAAAKRRGVRFGRPRMSIPSNWSDVAASFEAGELTRTQAAGELGVSPATFDRWRKTV